MADQLNGIAWTLSGFFPEFNGPGMIEFKQKLTKEIADINQAADRLGILSMETADAWETVVLAREDLAKRLSHVVAFVECLQAADAGNEAYTRERGALERLQAEFEKGEVGLLHAVKAVDDAVFESFCGRRAFCGADHFLRRLRERSRHLMSRPEEVLATDLGIDGIHAWGRLYDQVTGKLTFDMTWPDGRREQTPISRWRGMMSHPDRRIGQAAFEGGNRAWQQIEDLCAAALNAIAGTRLTLNRHRRIDHFLDVALFQAGIRRDTLDAMYRAIHDNLEIPREIFRIKARALGERGIRFFEREAPLPVEDETEYTWPQAARMVDRAFLSVYPALADYYRGCLDRRWVESEMRPGKRPGAFCTGSSVTNEQRVYMTFTGALGDITTLAHEVGHAWHGHLLSHTRYMARRYPMTLAETASIFAEHIFADGALADDRISEEQKLLILDTDLCGAAVLLLDITTRFEFESAVYKAREAGELPVSRLKSLMDKTQRRVFGDALHDGGTDPYFWASKLHFYITRVSFYNFPYTFGFLLARALAGMFREQGAPFLQQYERFLSLAGSDTVENVALDCLGVDITRPAFWSDAIRSLESPLGRYADLLQSRPH